MDHNDDPRPHLQCEPDRPPTPLDVLWVRRCWELVEELQAADVRRAA